MGTCTPNLEITMTVLPLRYWVQTHWRHNGSSMLKEAFTML